MFRSRRESSQPQTAGNIGESFDSEVVPPSLFLIAPILCVVKEFESTYPKVARLCRFYALEEANKLDSLSDGRGVRQFKTALERRLKRDDNEKLMDSDDMKMFYQYFHWHYVQPLEDAGDNADRAQLIKAYETSIVLFEVFQYVKQTESIGVDLEILQVQDKVDSKRSLLSPTVQAQAINDLPLVGNKAPDFEAKAVFDQEFIKVKLSKYIGKKYVIIFFYPLDFTFACPAEITAFNDRYEEFEKLNTQVLGVSVDSVFSHLAWVQTDRKSRGLGDLNYPLVSDITKSISKSFGVLIPDQGIALRGLFIIDKEGVIQHSTINNLGIGPSVDETMRTLQALQYVQENPDEVCPGEKSMKPDSKLSKEYFSAIWTLNTTNMFGILFIFFLVSLNICLNL